MISAKVNEISNLTDFHESVKKQYNEAHGAEYCAYHEDLQKLIGECESFKELGIHQGAATAAAFLSKPKPKKVHLVDINMSRFNENRELFESYAKEHDIELIVQQCDSTNQNCVSEVDILFIDSCHTPGHMTSELMIHGSKIKKYIVAHDTASHNGRIGNLLYGVLEAFCRNYPEWKVIKRDQRGYGHTIIKKMGNL